MEKKRLKDFIYSCQRKTLENFLRVAGLPTGGLKNALIQRLVQYIDVGPSLEFQEAVSAKMHTTFSRRSIHPVELQSSGSSGSTLAGLTPTMQPNETVPPNIDVAEYVRCQNNTAAATLMRVPQLMPGQSPTHQSSAHVQPPRARQQHHQMHQPYPPPSIGVSSNPMSSSNNNNTTTNSTYKSGTMAIAAAQQRPHSIATLPVNPLNDCVTLIGAEGSFRIPVSPPGLRFIDSPFFRTIGEIVPPTMLTPTDVTFTPGKRAYEKCLSFRITSDQAETITYHSRRLENKQRGFGVQVIMRFGRLDNPSALDVRILQTNSPLPPFADSLPIHLLVHVNGRSVQLPPLLPTSRPNLDGRRNARPINTTPLLRVSPATSNQVKLTWTHEYGSYSYYFFAIYLVQKKSNQELCDALRKRACQHASVIQKQIIDKLASNLTSNGIEEDNDELEIQNTLPVQLLCPLSKCRISLPVRGCKCQHIQCYDANTYLLINERKPAWKCPVCDCLAPFHELLVDGLLLQILNDENSRDVEEIVFNENGSWTSLGGIGARQDCNYKWSSPSSSSPRQQNGQPTTQNAIPSTSASTVAARPLTSPQSSGLAANATNLSPTPSVDRASSTASNQSSVSRKRSASNASSGYATNKPATWSTATTATQSSEGGVGMTIDLTESDEEEATADASNSVPKRQSASFCSLPIAVATSMHSVANNNSTAQQHLSSLAAAREQLRCTNLLQQYSKSTGSDAKPPEAHSGQRQLLNSPTNNYTSGGLYVHMPPNCSTSSNHHHNSSTPYRHSLSVVSPTSSLTLTPSSSSPCPQVYKTSPTFAQTAEMYAAVAANAECAHLTVKRRQEEQQKQMAFLRNVTMQRVNQAHAHEKQTIAHRSGPITVAPTASNLEYPSNTTTSISTGRTSWRPVSAPVPPSYHRADCYWPLDLAALNQISPPANHPSFPTGYFDSPDAPNPILQQHQHTHLQSQTSPQMPPYPQQFCGRVEDVDSASKLRPFIRAYIEYQNSQIRNSSPQGSSRHQTFAENAAFPQGQQSQQLSSNYRPPYLPANRADANLNGVPMAHSSCQSALDPRPGWPYTQPQHPSSANSTRRGPE